MTNPLQNKFDVGVIVGRFQVPELSEGHMDLINNVIESHKQVLIVIGTSATLGTKKNPLNYITRKQMIETTFPQAKVLVTHLMDVGNDEVWSNNLDNLIRQMYALGSVCLYGGRDSFINSYHGKYQTFELGVTDRIEGTKIRENVGKETVNSPDFRSGIIYQSQNQYPKTFPTVDIAVIKKYNINGYEVLLGKRPDRKGYRFIGGFVDPTDKSIEDSAMRELHEEVDVGVDNDSLEYVGSNLQQDYRYNSPDERIMTSLFKIEHMFGGHVISEFESLKWVEVNEDQLVLVEEAHKELFKILINNLTASE